MKKILATMGLFALTALSSMAATVTWSTDGSICNAANVCQSSFVIGTANGQFTVGFDDVEINTVDFVGFTNVSFGAITLACNVNLVAEATNCPGVNLNGYSLRIAITQTAPTPGGVGNISNNGTFTGSVTGSSSAANVTWPNPSQVSSTNTRYSIVNFDLALVSPTTNNGRTSVQGRITDTTIPEPATYAMLGSALVALGLLRRRKA